MAHRPKYRTFDQNFNFNLRRDHQKIFLWASCLWVGRRKEPILGYVPKNDDKKNLVHKGLNTKTFGCSSFYYPQIIPCFNSGNFSFASFVFTDANFFLFTFKCIYVPGDNWEHKWNCKVIVALSYLIWF